jgi:uncharacterized protein YhbP (UPF0306 family)
MPGKEEVSMATEIGLILSYFNNARVMQLASVAGDSPWICSVYFVADDDMNLYWLSLPTRRHSRDFAAHNKAAVAIVIELDMPVVGFQAEGTVSIVESKKQVKTVMARYIHKYGTGKDYYDKFIQGTNQHLMYKFSPDYMVLFDEKSRTKNPIQRLI